MASKATIKFGFKYFLWFVKFWYGLSMLVTRHRKTRVAEYTTYEGIAKALRWGDGWRPDPIKGALDVVTHPTRIQHRLDTNKRKIEDCDGHAAYWCVTLLKSGLAARAWFCFYQMQKNDSDVKSGHAVCVFEDHLGNLHWADYGTPRRIEDDWDWTKDSAKIYNATPIAAAMFEVTLRKRTDSLNWGKTTKKADF